MSLAQEVPSLDAIGANTKPQVDVTVLVAVQSPQVREALVAVIGDVEGFEVVGEASNDEHAVQLARAMRPTLAVVDEDLPGCCGTWTIQTLAQEQLAGAIVGIGLRGDGDGRARAAGAHGYVQTGASPEDLLSVLYTAIQCAEMVEHLPTFLHERNGALKLQSA